MKAKILRAICAALLCRLAVGGPLSHADGAASLYRARCVRCHGGTGRGDGPASTMQRPRPRDFTKGRFKFRSTPPGALPAPTDLEKVIAGGVLRTSMPGYKKFLSDAEIRALAGYVLDLARPSGLPDAAAISIPAGIDQIRPPTDEIEEGKRLYARFGCVSCHGDDGRGLGASAGGLRDENGFWIQPSDLTDPASYGGGPDPSDIYTRLLSGIDPSPMPGFAETMDSDSAIRIAWYVRSLQLDPRARRPVSREMWRKNLPDGVRGEYLTRAMSCALCHNAYDRDGMYDPDLYLGGGVAIRIPGLGTFPTRNITSHDEFGLGGWSEEEIIRALTTGHAKDRRLEAFAMPWVFFSHLSTEDARDIAAYLKHLAPAPNKIPPRSYDPFWKRILIRLRQLIGMETGRLEYPPGNAGSLHDRSL